MPRFIAQALAAVRPDLWNRAFAVTEQDGESSKTLVREVSESARAEGVQPGLPVFLVKRKWPRVLIVARDTGVEKALRSRMHSLWDRLTPVSGVNDHGAALLDLTGTPWSRKVPHDEKGLLKLAERLQKIVLDLGLEAASVGVASSQVVSRVLARAATPRGLRVCPAGREAKVLDPLPPTLLPGLSPKARERLRKYGMERIEMVRCLGKEELTLRFGAEGERLYTLARGLDMEPVANRRLSIKVETILPRDVNDMDTLRNQVRLTADKLAHALRLGTSRAARFTMVLTHSDRKDVRKTVRLHPPTAAFLPLAEKAVEVFFELYQRRVALRRIQIVVATPTQESRQRDLFEEVEKPGKPAQDALETAIDRIRRKRAFGAVISGSNVAAPLQKSASRGSQRDGRR